MTPLRIERLCLVTICVLTGALIGSNGVYAQSPVVPDGDTIQGGPERLYRQIAIGLIERALLVDDHHDENRIALATRAERIDPTLGDPPFILAEALVGDQRVLGRREDLLRRALSSDLERVPRDEVLLDLATLLRDHGRNDEVVDLLHSELGGEAGITPVSELIAWVEAPDVGDAQGFGPVASSGAPGPLQLLYLLSLAESGPRWYGARLMERMRARFPENADLAAADWARQDRVSLSALEWLDSYEQARGLAQPELYLRFLRFGPPAALVEPLLVRYRAAGGEDAMAEVLAHGAGAQSALSTIANDDPIVYEKVAWEVLGREGASVPDLPVPFEELLARIDAGMAVTVVRDFDRNGFWEERYHFADGSLQRWEFDGDQDGQVSEVAVAEGNTIRYYQWDQTAGETIQVQYSGFPRVDRVRWIDESGVIEWRPPRPVPYEVPRLFVFSMAPRDLLVGSSVYESGDLSRFSRQRRSDDSREIRGNEHQAEVTRMREWGMIR
jgi:hypothetical protein